MVDQLQGSRRVSSSTTAKPIRAVIASNELGLAMAEDHQICFKPKGILKGVVVHLRHLCRSSTSRHNPTCCADGPPSSVAGIGHAGSDAAESVAGGAAAMAAEHCFGGRAGFRRAGLAGLRSAGPRPWDPSSACPGPWPRPVPQAALQAAGGGRNGRWAWGAGGGHRG